MAVTPADLLGISHLSPRLLALVEAELEEREFARQYRWAVEEYTAGTAPSPGEDAEPGSAESAPTAGVDPPRSPTEPEYVGTCDAAALLGVSPRTLEGLRARGAGPPCTRIGRRVLYSVAELRNRAK